MKSKNFKVVTITQAQIDVLADNNLVKIIHVFECGLNFFSVIFKRLTIKQSVQTKSQKDLNAFLKNLQANKAIKIRNPRIGYGEERSLRIEEFDKKTLIFTFWGFFGYMSSINIPAFAWEFQSNKAIASDSFGEAYEFTW